MDWNYLSSVKYIPTVYLNVTTYYYYIGMLPLLHIVYV